MIVPCDISTVIIAITGNVIIIHRPIYGDGVNRWLEISRCVPPIQDFHLSKLQRVVKEQITNRYKKTVACVSQYFEDLFGWREDFLVIAGGRWVKSQILHPK